MRVIALVGLVAVGCADNYLATVRDSDKAAWRARPVVELETHPLFSTLPREVRPISDGSELWTFSNCGAVREQRECKSTLNARGDSVQTKCNGGGESTVCCHNQFVVRGGMVEEYRPVGNCMTNCSTRPGGSC